MIPREREESGLTSKCFKKEGAHFPQLGSSKISKGDFWPMLSMAVGIWLWVRCCLVNFTTVSLFLRDSSRHNAEAHGQMEEHVPCCRAPCGRLRKEHLSCALEGPDLTDRDGGEAG